VRAAGAKDEAKRTALAENVSVTPGINDLTTRALRILDYVVPGQWGNITDFNALIEDVTKVHDRKMIDKIHVKAMTRYLNRAEGYQTAMRLYQLVDKVDMVVAAAATASSVGRDIEWLSFLNRVTPDADTTQAIDAAIKLTAEIVAYFYLHDLPKTNLDAYVTALKSYKDAEIMRIAAFVVFDCLIPLGPDFLNRITEILHRVSSDDLGENKLFKAIKDYIPGDDADDKLGFVKRAFKSCSGWIDNFVEEKGINQAEVVGKLRKVIDFSDKGLDYVAAALDMSTNYFEHTGTQTVARVLIADAWEELGGASGGYTSGRKDIVALLRQRSRPYLFSNTVAPMIVAASLKTLEILSASTELRDKLMENTRYFREGLAAAGFQIKAGVHPIVPIMLGDAVLAQKMAARLLEKGVYVIGFFYPVVAKGQARIRVQISAAHARADLDFALQMFAEVKQEFGL